MRRPTLAQRARARARYLDRDNDTGDLIRLRAEHAAAMREEPDPSPQGFTEEELDEYFDAETRRKKQ